METIPRTSASIIAQPKWRLFTAKNVPVCNFLPRVICIEEITDPRSNQVVESRLHLTLDFGTENSAEFILPLSSISRIIWSDLDRRCILNPDCRQARRHIENSVRASLNQAPCRKRFRLDRTGVYHIGDEVVFAAGDKVICCSESAFSGLDFETDQIPFRLDIDPQLSVEKAFKGISELMDLSPQISHILIAHTIAGFIRSSFLEVGFKPTAMLFIIGESGMLKSHYIPQMVQLYNRMDGIRPVTRLNSSSRFIEEVLCEYSDCTAVLDDLHTAQSQKIKKNNENTVEEILRRVSDDTGRGYMDGKTHVQRRFRGNAIFIGEYMFGKASSIPRSLVLNLTRRPDGSVLDKYQRICPLTVSSFYHYFLKWYVEQYKEVCTSINTRLTEFRRRFAISENHGRFNDMQFYLSESYLIFLSFCEESKLISKEKKVSLYTNFMSRLKEVLAQQLLRYEKDLETSCKGEISKYIGQLYKNRHLKIAENVEEFDRDKHDGIVYNKHLCLRGKVLEKIHPHLEKDEVIQCLLNESALKLGADKRTIQISKLSGMRFYAIKLECII